MIEVLARQAMILHQASDTPGCPPEYPITGSINQGGFVLLSQKARDIAVNTASVGELCEMLGRLIENSRPAAAELKASAAKKAGHTAIERIKEYVSFKKLCKGPMEFTPRELKEATGFSWKQLLNALIEIKKTAGDLDFDALAEEALQQAALQ